MSRVKSTRAVMTVSIMVAGLTMGTASAQHGGHSQPGAAPGHQIAQSCAEQFTKVVGEGRGFGMAFAADQNGYPGPLHVLELKDRHTPQDARSPDRGPAMDLPPGPLGHPLT